MVTNNKVLTVSYGTFSCTLEGFEDSFDTMKAIAEYFRDLASDDRYFGAEPPTPDAEMLARIAEREIERRVSARMDQGAIVLSAADRAAPVEDVAEEAPAPKSAQDTQPQPEEQVAEQDSTTAADDADVAETAKEDDSAVAKAAAGAVAAAAVAAAVTADDAEAEVEDAPVAEEPVADEPEAAKQDDVAEIVEDDVPQVVEAVAPEAEVEADDVLAALQAESAEADTDILDAVAEDVAEDSIFAEDAEDAVADTTIDAIAADDVMILQDSIQAAIAEDTPAAEPVAELEDVAAEVVDAEVVEAASEEASDDGWEDAAEPASDYEENSIAAKLERIRAVVSRGSNEADEDGFSEDEHARDLEASDAPMTAVFDAVEAAEEDRSIDAAFDEDDEDDLDEAPKPALRARVVRMKKADFEEAVASGLLEAEEVDEEAEAAYADEDETFEEEVAAPVAEAPQGSSLTPEDEADLMAELAQVEAELKGEAVASTAPAEVEAVTEAEEADTAEAQDDYAEDVAEATPEVADAPAEVIAQPDSAEKGEADLSRLMAKANSEMEEPEGSRRRRAIAHLRAAVAATRAEKAAGKDAANKDTTVAYRDDLASVVRAVPGGKGNDEAEAKPRKPKKRSLAAPLKLVAEQRVDTAPEAPAAPVAEETETQRRVPVRPRRVSTDRMDREEIARTAAPVGTVASVHGGFADYAQSVGAATMPQILEAAAAYVTFVKGQERFSRPMLMRMARDVNEAEFSREEGLRSFGQLLRDQKIRKIAGGRFTADESIDFKPADRAAG